MLVYKGAMKGITLILSEENYTSKASFLSGDPIPNYGGEGAKQVKFSGYRETRGRFFRRYGAKCLITVDNFGLKSRVTGAYSLNFINLA